MMKIWIRAILGWLRRTLVESIWLVSISRVEEEKSQRKIQSQVYLKDIERKSWLILLQKKVRQDKLLPAPKLKRTRSKGIYPRELQKSSPQASLTSMKNPRFRVSFHSLASNKRLSNVADYWCAEILLKICIVWLLARSRSALRS